MLKHLRLIPFIVGIAAGLFMIYYYKAPPAITYKYPHPQNIEDRVYRDTNGTCYSYTATKVDCDANEATIRPYPISA
jgi:hypothetical protein